MTDCTPKDGYAGCNFKQTGRLDSCREPGGCLYALGYGAPVDRTTDAARFAFFAPEPKAAMPPGYSAELRIVSTRQLIRERELRRRSRSTMLGPGDGAA